MFTRPLVICALICCCCASCDTRPEPQLSEAEQAAYAHIERTPNLVITGITRRGDHSLIVATRQGDERVRYLIDSSSSEAAAHEMVQRLPRSGIYRHYDRTKPRGTFQSAR